MKGVKVNKMELKENFKMLEKIYNIRQEEIFTNDEVIKRKLNDITLEEIQKDIEKNVWC